MSRYAHHNYWILVWPEISSSATLICICKTHDNADHQMKVMMRASNGAKIYASPYPVQVENE